MGNIKNRAKKNKRHAKNWRKIIQTRKPKKRTSRNVVEEIRNDGQIFGNDNFKPTNISITDKEAGEHIVSMLHVDCSDDLDNRIQLIGDAHGEYQCSKIECDISSGSLDIDNIIEEDFYFGCFERTTVSNPNGNEFKIGTVSNEFDVNDVIEECYEFGGNEENGTGSSSNGFDVNDVMEECYEFGGFEENEKDQKRNECENEIGSVRHSGTQFAIDNNDNTDEELIMSESESIDFPEDSEGNNENVSIQSASSSQNGHQMFVNHENQAELKGRRIADIPYLFHQMINLFEIHATGCNSRMELLKETKMGLRSIFHLHCPDCGEYEKIETCAKNGDTIPVNKAATLGITSIGSGFYHSEEFCANMDIPCMSSTTFDVENKKLQKEWWALSKHHQQKALLEEIRIATERGDVDSAGNALIRIVCDGSWGKRSYGKGYSSLSGCAVIIEYVTKKVLYFDVKNKYCNICTKSYAKNHPPNQHECNINYTGPSSGMETEIIVEGFQHCELFGARFHKIVSDGDSSAFKEISERCIYTNPVLIVEKIECINHLNKNFNKKISALCTDSKFDRNIRKFIKHSIGDDISIGISCAAKHWRESNIPIIQKLKNLERDCLNAPYHYFGNHAKCDNYFCKKTSSTENLKTIELLKSAGLFHEILNLCNIYFASNVKSLIEVDSNNNWAEEFNNIVAKYLGGKRINYSLAGSYKGRVAAAVVQYNTNGHAGSEMHKFLGENVVSSCLKVENSRRRHYLKNEIARQAQPRKKATKDTNTKGYGECQQPDMSDRALEIAKNIELAKLDENRVNRDVVLATTLGQKYNTKWSEVRKTLINCDHFGRIIKARGPPSYRKLLEDTLYSKSRNTAEARHQRLYESEALKMFTLRHKDYQLEETGIFIDKELSFLGASPLRLYGADSIVNVLCPVKAFGKTFDEAMSMSKNLLPFKRKNRDLCIDERSSLYIEAQGQLHITGRMYAYVVIWLGEEWTIKKITVDHSFWKDNMKKKFQFFFDEAMIKEIANSRRARKMELRKYDPQTNTFIQFLQLLLMAKLSLFNKFVTQK